MPWRRARSDSRTTLRVDAIVHAVDDLAVHAAWDVERATARAGPDEADEVVPRRQPCDRVIATRQSPRRRPWMAAIAAIVGWRGSCTTVKSGDLNQRPPTKGATSMTRHIYAVCGAMALVGLTASAQSQQPSSQPSMTAEPVTATGCLKEWDETVGMSGSDLASPQAVRPGRAPIRPGKRPGRARRHHLCPRAARLDEQSAGARQSHG